MMMRQNQMVSVITPVYNAGRFLTDMLESVIRQSYQDIEVILVDDCSTDNSADVIASYASRYPNIKYRRLKNNQGAAVARNVALEMAEGRYVAFLDSDDVWQEGKLERQIAFMNETGAAISCTAMEVVAEDGARLGRIRSVRGRITYDFLLRNTMIATSTVIVDRNITGDFRMPMRRGGQDYATWLMLMRDGTDCFGLNEPLTQYRIVSSSLSSNKLKSIRQVWSIQTEDEHVARGLALLNVCCFILNGIVKHFF